MVTFSEEIINENPGLMNDEFTELKKQISNYVHSFFSQLQFKIAGELGTILANITTYIIITILGVFFIVLISIAAGFWLSDKLDSFARGFGLIALFYLFIIFLLMLLKKWLIELPFIHGILNKMHGRNSHRNK